MIAKMAIGIGLALSADSAFAQESRSDLFSQQPGRFQIVFSPQIRADTFMIDTATGKVWQLTRFSDLKDDPLAWQLMRRIDNDADVVALIGEHGLKPKEPPASPAVSPKPQAPMRLNSN